MRLGVSLSRISHDRLQDEVIIINVGSGAYYSGSGPAADIWSIFARGSTVAEAARLLASAYEVDEKAITSDVKASADYLLKRGLIETVASDDKAIPVLPEAVRGKWVTPQFSEHTDMWELIKLDPIHEVDEAGWPAAKA